MAIIDMTGKKFGKLLVIKKEKSVGSAQHISWLCKCDCGNETIAIGASIRAKRTLSCGCESIKQRITSEKVKKHGKSYDRVYRIWCGMITRCNDLNSPKSHLYAKKGIKVCERWKKFENFYADMGDPLPEMTIERIDGNKNYEPSNCKWATRKEQANNTTKNKKIEFNNQIKNLNEWATELNIKSNTLLYRLRRGWSIEKALQTIS